MTVKDNSAIEQRKLQLINIITQLHDSDLLDAIESLLIDHKNDWWQTISKEEKQAIDLGLNDVRHGRILSHEQVMKEVEERYKDL